MANSDLDLEEQEISPLRGLGLTRQDEHCSTHLYTCTHDNNGSHLMVDFNKELDELHIQ
jgi:hypothetical protein